MYARGFLGVVPTPLIGTIIDVCRPQEWPAVYCCCSGTFRTERGLLPRFPNLVVRSNDVSLMSTSLARVALNDPLPFEFKDELAFIEELQIRDPVDRVGAIQVAMVYASYAKAKYRRLNEFKRRHLDHIRFNFVDYVRQLRPSLLKLIETMPIKSYFAGDFRDHIDAAVAEKGGIIAFPPTFAMGYERMFAFLHENVAWEPPAYRVFEPEKDVRPLLERLDASGLPYFLYLDQLVDGFEPQVLLRQRGARPIYGYGRALRASFRTRGGRGKPFTYKTLDLAKVTEQSRLWVQPALDLTIAFLREAFLKKSIMSGKGDFGVLVYIDDMLVGAISYRKPTYRGAGKKGTERGLFVLSDFAIAYGPARLSKLVARVATVHETFHALETRTIMRYTGVMTTVFSDHPEAMKYRGSWKAIHREEINARAGRYTITYKSEIREESLAQCFRWWWRRDGAREVAAARSRLAEARPEGAQAA